MIEPGTLIQTALLALLGGLGIWKADRLGIFLGSIIGAIRGRNNSNGAMAALTQQRHDELLRILNDRTARFDALNGDLRDLKTSIDLLIDATRLNTTGVSAVTAAISADLVRQVEIQKALSDMRSMLIAKARKG